MNFLHILLNVEQLHLLADVVAPDHGVSESVPQVDHPIVAGGDELRLGWRGRQGPHVGHVAHHDLLEVEVEVAGEDRVLGGAKQQLAAPALAQGSYAAQVLWKLRLHPSLAVECVELHNPAVFAAAGDDAAVLEDTDGEDGAVVHLPHHLSHCVVAASPDKHVAVGVAGDHVPCRREGEAGDIPENKSIHQVPSLQNVADVV